MTSDRAIHQQISDLVAEEREARHRLQAQDSAPDDERARLRELEVQLDQCWDLLRQRQGLRDAGSDPDAARVRPAGEVEGYLS